MHCDSATKQIKTVLRILEGTRSRVWGRGAPLAPIRPARMCQDPACHWWLCFASLAVEVGCALPESLPSQLKGSRTLCQRRSPHSDRPHPRHTIRVTTTGPLACLALGKYRSPQVASVFAVLITRSTAVTPLGRWFTVLGKKLMATSCHLRFASIYAAFHALYLHSSCIGPGAVHTTAGDNLTCSICCK